MGGFPVPLCRTQLWCHTQLWRKRANAVCSGRRGSRFGQQWAGLWCRWEGRTGSLKTGSWGAARLLARSVMWVLRLPWICKEWPGTKLFKIPRDYSWFNKGEYLIYSDNTCTRAESFWGKRSNPLEEAIRGKWGYFYPWAQCPIVCREEKKIPSVSLPETNVQFVTLSYLTILFEVSLS